MHGLLKPEWTFCPVCAALGRARKTGPLGDGTTPDGWHLGLIRIPEYQEEEPDAF